MGAQTNTTAVVLISANVEWKIVREYYPQCETTLSPYGECMALEFDIHGSSVNVPVFHGGWGKIAAAASTQYCIDKWSPEVLVNLGTCGGFKGRIHRGTIVLVDRAIVYDIDELMGDRDEHIAYYTTSIDLSWLGRDYPHEVRRGLLVSGDRDILPQDVARLERDFGAFAGDWESGAIAYVAQRNNTRCLILRGVSDIVSGTGSEAYGNLDAFVTGTRNVLKKLLKALPSWLSLALRK